MSYTKAKPTTKQKCTIQDLTPTFDKYCYEVLTIPKNPSINIYKALNSKIKENKMTKTKDNINKEFFEKGISPTLDANKWKGRHEELSELASNAKVFKVHMFIENSVELEQAHREDLKYIGKEWVILK